MLFGFYLMFCYLNKLNDDLIDTIVEECKNDNPFPDDFPQELHRWWKKVGNNCVPESCTLKIALSYTFILSSSNFVVSLEINKTIVYLLYILCSPLVNDVISILWSTRKCVS